MNLAVSTIVFVAITSAFPAWSAVRGDDVLYVGGTHSQIPEKTEGKLDMSSAESAIFDSKKGGISIPYKKISSLEYGQKAGRRVGVALAVSPVALLSKKRKHFLSITYEDAAGAKQGAVFEISKGRTHSVISTMESRSGKKIEFESQDAQKHYEKEGK